MSEKRVEQQYSTGWIMLLALFTSLGPLSIDMYLPALPQMAQDFEVSTPMVANTLPAYFLGLAVGQLIYGPISDRIGRKKPLYFGMALFAVASLLCLLASDVWSLIAARILQALGGCVGVVMARAAIRDRLDIHHSAQAFASMMIVMGIAPILAPTIGAWILYFFDWYAVFVTLFLIGVICLLCVHFFFKETLTPERRLKLTFKQVFILYSAILKDKSFRLPMMAGCFTGAALFCYISSASAILMDQYHLSQQQFAYAFGFNASGIILLSAMNKRLAHKLTIIQRLKLGGCIQVFGALIIVLAGLLNEAPFVMLMCGLFCTVSGIGFTGPNAMALAMSQQGARAGTASALMGSGQFACGLLGGVVLNILVWSALLNMGILMLLFTSTGLFVIVKLAQQLKTQKIA
ncbi:multidrug effflux MFS transporter [Acinetobacter silvestris]|uniref:Bcr/CflA family efflux transporter n=1 Tax=Acinetobacter silvestris TaxID=1977882 RepID=A0A1Y3CI50_9GAMM|nr:multidrug effflux MFS transporter [Acinetobacter silvestris]OTG65572.1 Bcr/CflA family drug resistance efflux transporter [Acinetobacter silvestris]